MSTDVAAPLHIKVLREIDKFDKVGTDGLQKRLTTGVVDASGARIAGAGLHPVQAEVIISFLDARFGEGVSGMKRWFDLIGTRFKLIVALESVTVDRNTCETLWDRLIDMPVSADETWRGGQNGEPLFRPKNIGWALDDIASVIQAHAEQVT